MGEDYSVDAAGIMKEDAPPHFVLIHGISGGAWCWYKIKCLMENCGYKVTCLDLKGAGMDQTDPNAVVSFEDYNQPLIDFLSSLHDHQQVILVGHSAGGLSLSDAIHRFGKKKIKLAVFVAATMLKSGYLTDQDIKDKNMKSPFFDMILPLMPITPQDFVASKLSDEDKGKLIQPFTEDEIKAAIWKCDGSKSPGPDGFNMNFWKSSWEIIKRDFIKVMEEFQVHGKIPRGANSSFIVLIPKKEDANSIDEFRPISLIGSLYKVIAKVLAERMKVVMDSIISENQSAFIRDRYILDGVVILNEAIAEAKRSGKGRIIFKIDFAKAYDSVEWDYLDMMLDRFNFHPVWRKWIKGCLFTASANVLVNGSPSGEFFLEKGLRQGDPLSPFLFLIAAEGLQSLIRRAVERSFLVPAEIGKEKVQITHLQYADDTIFLLDDKEDNAEVVKAVLKLFHLLSGLSVNFHKCSLMGIGVDAGKLERMARVLNCRVGTIPFKYLGIKVGGRSKSIVDWNYLVEKVRKKIEGWKTRKLSLAGRATLAKSVLQAIPIYQLSFSFIPKATVRSLNSLFCKFLWGGSSNARPIPWVKWEDLCFNKKEGGLGMKNVEWFNYSLVLKWVWRFLNGKGQLWTRVVTSIYGEVEWSEEGLRLAGTHKPRVGWWSKILAVGGGQAGKWFSDNIDRKIGEGRDTKFWLHKWVGSKPLKLAFSRLFQLSENQDALISECGSWENGVWVWDFKWRRGLLDREMVNIDALLSAISNSAPIVGSSDGWFWRVARGGKYTTRSAYALIEATRNVSSLLPTEKGRFVKIWETTAPQKARFTSWRILRNRMSTCDNLIKRNIPLDEVSSMCNACFHRKESINHTFLLCPKTVMVWDDLQRWLGLTSVRPHVIFSHFDSFTNLGKGKKIGKFLTALWMCTTWQLWKGRNVSRFEDKSWEVKKVINEIKAQMWSWNKLFNLLDVEPSSFSWYSGDISSLFL